MEEGGRGSTLQPKTIFFLSILSIVPTILYYTAYFSSTSQYNNES